MVNSILILAVVVLPGWVSVSAAQLYHPRAVARTVMMQLGMMLYHAAIVHIAGIGSVALATLVFPQYFLDTLKLDRVLTHGALDFAKDSPTTAFWSFGLYFVWMIAGSTISGVMDLPVKATSLTGRVARKIRLANAPVQDEPVWYGALNLARRRLGKSNIQVFVQMKNGDVYVGDLASYTILPDLEESKDMRLGTCVWYPAAERSSPVEMNFADDEGGVLLNTANVSSIHYQLVDDYDADGEG